MGCDNAVSMPGGTAANIEKCLHSNKKRRREWFGSRLPQKAAGGAGRFKLAAHMPLGNSGHSDRYFFLQGAVLSFASAQLWIPAFAGMTTISTDRDIV